MLHPGYDPGLAEHDLLVLVQVLTVEQLIGLLIVLVSVSSLSPAVIDASGQKYGRQAAQRPQAHREDSRDGDLAWIDGLLGRSRLLSLLRLGLLLLLGLGRLLLLGLFLLRRLLLLGLLLLFLLLLFLLLRRLCAAQLSQVSAVAALQAEIRVLTQCRSAYILVVIRQGMDEPLDKLDDGILAPVATAPMLTMPAFLSIQEGV